MRNRLKVLTLSASLAAGAILCSSAFAADAPAPALSKGVVKQLAAANEALKNKKYDDALAKIKEAQSAPGEKTAYDRFVIDELLLPIYAQKQDYADLAPVLQSAAANQYATPEQQKSWLRALFNIDNQGTDYAKTIELGQELIKKGYADNDTYVIIANSENKLGKFKDAAATIQEVIGKQERPEERLLVFQWNCYVKANDDADAAKVVEKLVSYYPKPEYWANALVPLRKMDIKDPHLQLNVFRLENDVGVLKNPGDYAEMAEIALDAGYPGETVSVLQQAFAKNVFTEQRDKDRYQHLLDGAKERAAKDQASLPAFEQDANNSPTGDKLVQLGAAYLSYNQPEKAIAAINKGIAKGGLKNPDEANLLLGMAPP